MPFIARRRRGGPPWKRLVVGVVALALVVLAIVVVSPESPPGPESRLPAKGSDGTWRIIAFGATPQP